MKRYIILLSIPVLMAACGEPNTMTLMLVKNQIQLKTTDTITFRGGHDIQIV